MSWQDKINQVWQGDCMDLMKEMPDKCVDLVVTDPPYGLGQDKDQERKSGYQAKNQFAKRKFYGTSDWDKEIPKKEVFDEIFRISKNQIIFGGNYFTEFLFSSPCWIVWDKDNGETDFADCELAWASFPTAVRKFKWKWQGMLQEQMGKEKEYRFHPTQKPVPVIKWILQKYSKETDIIFDPFMGSWTTARACKDLGRNFIGAELSEEYCKIGRQRLRQEVLL